MSLSEPFETKNNSRFLIRVSDDIPSLEECSKFVSDANCGAISTFTGITRDNFEGKNVSRLSYEGYVAMAEKELRTICDEACEKFSDVHKIAAVHILGDCPVGSASVILACSSPHRKDSLNCVQFLIDELKKRVPLWKKESYHGEHKSVWKENAEWHL